MPEYREKFLRTQPSVTELVLEWQNQMNCLSHAITQSLDHAHAHHIQRLMVIGNFALLAGLDPAEVHHWYLGIYIDAFEWVELPNTIGMSQFADGGLLATKPYVSSAAYIDRMSDYCKGCHYDKKLRVGENACPFNALYWDFFSVTQIPCEESTYRYGLSPIGKNGYCYGCRIPETGKNYLREYRYPVTSCIAPIAVTSLNRRRF
jgi:deoxyribodipyrimidine photolyase-like uncharacterized protein